MSIYDSKVVSEGEYFDQLRSNIERDYNKGILRADEDFGFSKERLDNGLGDTKEDVAVGKVRAKENFVFTEEGLNRQLGRIAQNTFRRFVKKAPSIPTQIGLQNLATRGARVDKDRQDFLNQRGYDRSVFDLNKIETRAIRDHDLGSRINVTGRDRRKEDATDSRDDRLLGQNRQETSISERLEQNNRNDTSSFSNVFSQGNNYEDLFKRFF